MSAITDLHPYQSVHANVVQDGLIGGENGGGRHGSRSEPCLPPIIPTLGQLKKQTLSAHIRMNWLTSGFDGGMILLV